MPETCLVTPPASLDSGADVFARVAAALPSDRTTAVEILSALDESPYASYWNAGEDEWVKRHKKGSHVAGEIAKVKGDPLSATRRAVAERDGWRCRYCGLRLLSREFVIGLNSLLPEAFEWGPTDATRHKAGLVLLFTPDHVNPKWNGGTNEEDNLVASCGTCNYMKWSCTLDELGLSSPWEREPVRDDWNGLVGALAL